MTIPCPGRCGGRIRLHLHGPLADLTVRVTPDPFDVRRHAPCVTPPGPGEPLLVAA